MEIKSGRQVYEEQVCDGKRDIIEAMEIYAQQFQAPTDVLTTEIMVLRERNEELVEMLERVKQWWDSEDIINDHLPIEEIQQLITKAKEV